MYDRLSQNPTFFNLSKWTFRLGVASLLIVNGVYAFVRPEDFSSILEANFIGQHIPENIVSGMVFFAGVNDIALGLLLISGKFRLIAYIWLGLWFATIAGVKLTNLIF